MKMFSALLAALIAFAPLGQAASVSNPTFDKIIQGRSNTTTKEYRFNVNQGNANPGLRGNATTGKLEFTQDGSLWKNVGSGAGGGGGIILNDNSGFEDGAGGWVASGGVFTVSQVVANVGFGNSAGSWVPSASGQTLSYSPILIPTGLQGKTGTISIYTKGGDAGYVFEVTDGTNAIATSSPLATTTGYSAKKILAFTYPASGSVTLRLRTTTASPAAIFIDDFKLGQELVVAQAPNGDSWVGSVFTPGTTNCAWGNANGALSDMPADTDCPLPTVDGDVSAPATRVPGVLVKDYDPAYVYKFYAKGTFAKVGSSAAATNFWRFSDGTRFSPTMGNYTSVAADNSYGLLFGEISPAAKGANVLVTVQTATPQTGTAQILNDVAGLRTFQIDVYRTPKKLAVDASQGITVDQSGWTATGAFYSSSPLDYGSSPGGYIIPTGSGTAISLATGQGSAPVKLACSGTNPSTGNTCTAGNGQLGFVTTVPSQGLYEACFKFNTTFYQSQNVTTEISALVYQTSPTNEATVLASSIAPATAYSNRTSGLAPAGSMIEVCGDFNLSAGENAFRLAANIQVPGSGNNAQIRMSLAGDAYKINPSFKLRRRVEYADVIKIASQEVSAQVTSATALSVTANNPILFPTATWDTNGIYSPATGRFTIPTDKPGRYSLNCTGIYSGTAGDYMFLYKNGSFAQMVSHVASTNHVMGGEASAIGAPGDYFTAVFSASRSLGIATGFYQPTCTFKKIN